MKKIIFLLCIFPFFLNACDNILIDYLKKEMKICEYHFKDENKEMRCYFIGQYSAYFRILSKIEGYSDKVYPDNF